MLNCHHYRKTLLVALVLVITLVGRAPAQNVIPISWIGGASGDWNSAANWTPTTVPLNGVPTNTEYAVTISQPSGVNVTLDTRPTYIDSLNFSAANSTLTISGISSLAVTNANSGNVVVGSGNSIMLGTGTEFENSGSLLMQGNVTLQGGGTITLNNASSNIIASSANVTITNGLTINGLGLIGSANPNSSDILPFQLVNQPSGLIDANVPTNNFSTVGISLNVSGASTNAGTLRASNGGSLSINLNGGTLTNSGTIAALDGSTVGLTNGTIRFSGNGQFTTTGTGVIGVGGAVIDGTASPIVNTGNLQFAGTTIEGALINTGTISLVQQSTVLGTNVTLSGAGTLNLGGRSILGSAAGPTLTNASTIVGRGFVGQKTPWVPVVFANQSAGLIDADVSGQTLFMYPGGASTNAGTLEASGGGTLALNGPNSQTAITTLTNTGTIAALDGSKVSMSYPVSPGPGQFTIAAGTGGQFMTSGTGVIQASNIALDGTAAPIVNAGSFQVVYFSRLKGTLTNNGSFSVPAQQILGLSADTIVNGSGTLTLGVDASGNAGAILAYPGGQTLTNASTIAGAGNIGGNPFTDGFGNLAVVNQSTGLIDANATGQPLIIEPNPSLNNAGTLRASNGGILTLTGGGILTNTGVIRSEGGAVMSLTAVNLTNLSGNTLTGGSYQAVGASSVIMIANNADIRQINGASVTLDSGGAITDQNGLDAFRNLASVGPGGSFALLNGHNQMLAGPLSNSGIIQVSNATTFTITAGYTQTGGQTQLTDSASTLTTPTATFSGGSLKGNGVINANINFNGGTLAPGNSPGMLTVNGALNLGSGATFQAEIGGVAQGSQYDFLSESGDATLGGALQLVLINGFSPTNSQTFTILTDSGPLAGTFANVANGGTLLTSDGLGVFTVNYGPSTSFGSNNVVLSDFVSSVPEPGSLLWVGAAVVGWGFRPKRK